MRTARSHTLSSFRQFSHRKPRSSPLTSPKAPTRRRSNPTIPTTPQPRSSPLLKWSQIMTPTFCEEPMRESRKPRTLSTRSTYARSPEALQEATKLRRNTARTWIWLIMTGSIRLQSTPIRLCRSMRSFI